MLAIHYTRPWLYPKQSDALFNDARYCVVEATVKAGKTMGALTWLLEQAFTQRGIIVWWVSPIFAQAKVVYRRTKRAIPQDIFTANESELTLTLINGSVVHFKSAEHPDSLYGEDVWACVIDEFTRVKEEAWFAIRSTLTATRGPARLIGNVRGRHNWGYRLARQAEAGKDGYHYARITSADAVEAGILSALEIEDAKNALPAPVFRELYYAEATEDGSNPFDIQAIRDCTAPIGEGPATTFGIDLARGRTAGSDWTVMVALNKDRQVCGFDRFQMPWAQQVQRIRWLVGITPALIDATGVGDPIVEELQRGPGQWEGYKFTQQSKQVLMEGLALSISQRAIGFPEGPIVQELENFEYIYSRTGVQYSAPEGLNDDCVCALALANHHYRSGVPRIRWM